MKNKKGHEAAGLPHDFVERIKQQLGDASEEFFACYQKERTFGLRCNPLKIKKEKLEAALGAFGIVLEAIPWAWEGFYYANGHPKEVCQPGKLPLHEAGAYYIQEPSAMMPVELLAPVPGERVLDLCAAPGGKSTQIAGRLQGMGLLVSNEVVPARAKTLSRNIERMGVVNAVVLHESPQRLAEHFPAFFDKILVDAPCSGEGMFRKDPAACGEWSLAQVEKCADRQREILSHAAEMLRPGGTLVYATCTFAPRENEETAAWFVKEFPQFSLMESRQVWPHVVRGEGHYMARFQTEGVAVLPKAFAEKADAEKYRGIGHLYEKSRPVEKKQGSPDMAEQLLMDFCAETLSKDAAAWISGRLAAGRLAMFGSHLYLLPDGIGSLAGLKTERAGLHLGSLKKNRFEPSHALAMALHPEDVRQSVEPEEPRRYLRGETLAYTDAGSGIQKGWTLITVEGCSLGWGRASQGILKNHYPKGLRY